MSPSPTTSSSPTDILTAVRQRILSGAYPVGTWLPPERDLAEEFGVTRRAVRRVVARLSEEGLLRCRPRFRPIVEAPPGEPERKSVREAAVVVDVPTVDPGAGSGAGARLVALVMWHGDPAERGATAQQRIFWGMNQRLARDGFHGVFLDLGDTIRTESENAEREAIRLRYARDNGFAGIIFYAYAYRRNRELIQETARHMPLVLIDRMVPGIQADFVGVDNHGAEYEATRHLQAQGHRRILFVTTAEPINTVQDRMEGYRQALAEAPGGPLSEEVLTALTDWSVPEWPIFESLFRLPAGRRPTAVLCVNDHIAHNVHRRLIGLGLSVPKDVALCGFDDTVAFLPNGTGLTTVAQPFEQIGRAAAEAFLARYHSGPPYSGEPRHVELPARLIVRASTSAGVTTSPALPEEGTVVPTAS